jgi:hypothetical protein
VENLYAGFTHKFPHMSHPTRSPKLRFLSRAFVFSEERPFDAVVASVVGIALFFSTIIAPLFYPHTAKAAALSGISDTLVDSGPSVATNHTLSFVASSTLSAGNTIKVQFDPSGDAFNLTSLVAGDVSATGFSVVAACTPAGSEVTASVDSSAPDENVTFTVCVGDSIGTGTKTILFGNSHILNPASEGPYVVRVTYGADSGDAAVAIIQHVVVTAAVDTSFIFTVLGVASGSSVNGDSDTTATATTPTAMEFGSLASGTPVLLAQDLTVITNARNGFAVTVIEDQNLSNGAGADIDMFVDGNANPTPTAWVAPTAVLANENTHGHFGLTSEDSDLNGDEFGVALYAGNFATTTRTVFAHNGPSDGVTPNIGYTRVGYKIEVSDLQAAANYTNQLIYVATPTF